MAWTVQRTAHVPCPSPGPSAVSHPAIKGAAATTVAAWQHINCVARTYQCTAPHTRTRLLSAFNDLDGCGVHTAAGVTCVPVASEHAPMAAGSVAILHGRFISREFLAEFLFSKAERKRNKSKCRAPPGPFARQKMVFTGTSFKSQTPTPPEI